MKSVACVVIHNGTNFLTNPYKILGRFGFDVSFEFTRIIINFIELMSYLKTRQKYIVYLIS